MKRSILLLVAVIVILLGCVDNCKAQHTYDPTQIYLDIITHGGMFIFDMKDVSVDPGINTQVGLRFRDSSTELYVEILGGYNSLNFRKPDGNKKEYLNNVDFNIGVFLTKILSLKLGLFFIADNSNTTNNSIGGSVATQVDYPITKRLNLILTGTLGGNLKSESDFGTLIKGNIGVSYNINNINY